MKTTLEMAAGALIGLFVTYLFEVGVIVAWFLTSRRQLAKAIALRELTSDEKWLFAFVTEDNGRSPWREVALTAILWPRYQWLIWRSDRKGDS